VKIDSLICPSDGPHPNQTHPGNNYMVCAGARRNIYDAGNPRKSSGAFVRRRETSFAMIRDGTANTIMASEILKGDESGSLTLERDFTNQLPGGFDEFPTQAQIESAGATCDTTAQSWAQSNAGRWWMGSFPGFSAFSTTAPPNWKHVTCCSGGGFGYACDRHGLVPPRSWHPGGVNAALCDGSVTFISDTIDHNTFMWLGAREDGNAVAVP
jgi:prepilin-type processing-associated H-X9-DG protein